MKRFGLTGTRRAIRFATVLSLVSTAGCAHFVLVESRLVTSNRQANAELTPTAQYSAALMSIKRVAVRAPDACTSLTAAERTGTAAASGTVVSTRCGVEMAELERGLTRAGYIVSSWRSLENMVSVDHVTPAVAAQKLGAQVLFQVNSLERVQQRAGTDARWERRFFESDVCGEATQPQELGGAELAAMRQIVAPREAALLSRPQLGAMLDVNAVMVETGQTIWFYRWVKVDSSAADKMTRVLTKKVKSTYVPIAPGCQAKSSNEKVVKTGESEAVSTGATASSDTEAEYFGLIRDVVADFVAKFKGSADPNRMP